MAGMGRRHGVWRQKPVVAPQYEAEAQARAAAPGVRAVVLVEGVSDQLALEAAALRLGRDLMAEGVVVVPAGGVGGIAALAARFAGLRLAGLCDAAEVTWVCRALVKAGVGIAVDQAGLARLGFFVCDRDLEDELIRAVGADGVAALLTEDGDVTAFRTLQRQRAWQDAPLHDQVRRFLGVGAGRKRHYAQRFVQSVALERMPEPLRAVLHHVSGDG